MSQIRDSSLAGEGHKKINWVKKYMQVLGSIREEFEREKPFAGLKVALSIHLEAKTAYLCQVLAAGGAQMYVTGSNPLSTQDDVAAALADCGMRVFAWHNCTPAEYSDHIRNVLKDAPDVIIDDGGDLVAMMHSEFSHLCGRVLGGCEETTTGVLRLVSMNRDGALKFPMMLVNDAKCKFLFDNRYGTGQSVWDGINRTTNLVAAGKTAVVCGYGWCGKGVAMRAKGLAAKVIVTEIDPIKAIEAVMDGFDVMPMRKSAEIGDIFITVTGCRDVISREDFLAMKDGAVLCNAGHFNLEIDMETLAGMAVETIDQRKNIVGYKLENGKTLSVLAEGRLVNLASGDGHPAEIMDMSFSIQALCARHVAKSGAKQMINQVPEEIDMEVARRKLNLEGYHIDTLTDVQKSYLGSWKVD